MRHFGGRRVACLLAASVLVTGVLGACEGSPGASDAGATTPVATPTVAETLLSPVAADPDAKVGGYAPRLPPLLRQIPSGAEVLLSSARLDSEAKTVQVSLNLTSEQSGKKIIAFYRKLATQAGFTEVDPEADMPRGAAQLSFVDRRTGEVLSVAVVSADGVRTVSVSGTLAATDPE